MTDRPIDVSRGLRPTDHARERERTPPLRRELVLDNLDRLAWYVARVTPGEEFAVVDRLDRRGVVAFTPTATVYRRANRAAAEKRLKLYAAAPGYVVAGLDPVFPRWASLFAAQGVREVLGDGGLPTRLRRRYGPDGAPRGPHPVEAVIGLSTVDAEARRYMETRGEFDVGDRVSVRGVDGLEAEVRELDATTGQARVLVQILGAAREITVGIAQLKKAS